MRNPLKFLNQIGSPLKVKKFGGKENKGRVNGFGYGNGQPDFSPKSILRVNNSMDSSRKAVLKLSYPVKVQELRPLKVVIRGFRRGGILIPCLSQSLLLCTRKSCLKKRNKSRE